jgi:MoxR-like ATPase
MLDEVAIIGWKSIEATVLSALVARHPLMLVGSHGANKTEGAEILTYATLGRSVRFQPYDTRLIHQDDLLGYANPASLREGDRVTYAHTDLSIWGAKGILLDEFNRVNPFIASKTMEIVRTKKVMGRALDLELVFAAANPPGGAYDTVYLDPAVASRFAIVRVPDRLSSEDLDRILKLPDTLDERVSVEALTKFKETIDAARAWAFSDEDIAKARMIVRSIMLSLRTEPEPPVHVSARQGRVMVRMLLACEALGCVREDLRFSEKAKVAMLMSLLPELSGMCRVKLSDSIVQGHIARILSGFRLGDKLVTSPGLLSLLNSRVPDTHVWTATVKSRVQTCTDPTEILSYLSRLAEMRDRVELDDDSFSALVAAGVVQYLSRAADESDARFVSVSWDRSSLKTYLRGLLASRPAAVTFEVDELLDT